MLVHGGLLDVGAENGRLTPISQIVCSYGTYKFERYATRPAQSLPRGCRARRILPRGRGAWGSPSPPSPTMCGSWRRPMACSCSPARRGRGAHRHGPQALRHRRAPVRGGDGGAWSCCRAGARWKRASSPSGPMPPSTSCRELARFRLKHPKLSVRLVTGNSAQLLKRLEDFSIDIAVTAERPPSRPSWPASCGATGWWRWCSAPPGWQS